MFLAISLFAVWDANLTTLDTPKSTLRRLETMYTKLEYFFHRIRDELKVGQRNHRGVEAIGPWRLKHYTHILTSPNLFTSSNTRGRPNPGYCLIAGNKALFRFVMICIIARQNSCLLFCTESSPRLTGSVTYMYLPPRSEWETSDLGGLRGGLKKIVPATDWTVKIFVLSIYEDVCMIDRFVSSLTDCCGGRDVRRRSLLKIFLCPPVCSDVVDGRMRRREWRGAVCWRVRPLA